MTTNNQNNTTLSRRKVLVAAAATSLTIPGCLDRVTGNDTEEDEEEYPEPEIVEATAEVENFRQTDERSVTFVLVRNNGALGEVRLTAQATGRVAAYDEGERLFSLEEGQEHQTRFEFFTHEGAEEVQIEIEATRHPENSDVLHLSEEETPDAIDYH